ncbi:MAG: hypothetical protein J7L39_02750 [Candidatus Aenigmarchaeota archaeon]|nr:hypothetical protein [Candidatus Aenigmarchaeota archaeon]
MIDLLKDISRKHNNIKLYIIPGSVAETRNKVLSLIEGEIIVLDADEIAPKDWLNRLVRI